jgi:hypothetical protein
MDSELFLSELVDKDLSFVVSKWLIERVPFIFNGNLEEYILWKEKLSALIGVDSRAISLIGSACLGFSINPNKNYENFNSESDIDIAIISHFHFDHAWHRLRNLGSDLYKLSPIQRNSVNDHVNRLIYWGTIASDQILQILPFGKDWTLALFEMAKIQPTEGKVINVRIYNDFESLRAYHVNNLNHLRGLRLVGG